MKHILTITDSEEGLELVGRIEGAPEGENGMDPVDIIALCEKVKIRLSTILLRDSLIEVLLEAQNAERKGKGH